MTEQSPADLVSPLRVPSPAGVERAAAKIAAMLPPTPLLPLTIDGVTIWCKAEGLQPIGAFKIRGAWHRLSDLSDAERARGVVAFSSGNHAQGVAWAARRLGIAATIVMPADAPHAKMQATKDLGATVVTYDRRGESREEIAKTLAGKSGATVVPSFDDPWIIEGQGSLGIEAAAQLAAQADGATFDSIVACCGGGGLASGTALALPGAAVTIVEPDCWDDMGRSLRGGTIVPVAPDAPDTLCDALQTPRVSPLTFDILRAHQAKAVSVSDTEAQAAMRLAFERLQLVLEPGGAVALAAVMTGKVAPGRHTLVTLSGGNVDAAVYLAMLANAPASFAAQDAMMSARYSSE